MGERTQIVLKLTDKFGRVRNKVYHEQWGFGKTMPMIFMNFLSSCQYGSERNTNRKCTSHYKSDIADLRELDNMSKADREKEEKILNETSVHNLSLCSWDVSDEYETVRVVPNKIVEGTPLKYDTDRELSMVNITDEDKENSVPLLEFDFDITKAEHINMFVGDNNCGMCVIAVTEKLQEDYSGWSDYEYSIGFTGAYQEDYPKSVNIEKDVLDFKMYARPYDNYATKEFQKMFDTFCECFNVNQIGKKVKEKV